MNAYAALRIAGAAPDDALFAIHRDGAALTYGGLDALTGRLAGRLAALGVAPGDRVAAQTPKSVEALALYFATIRAGAVYLPLNPSYTRGELDYFLGDAEPALFVANPAQAETLAPLAAAHRAGFATLGRAGDGSLLDGLESVPATWATVPREDDDLAAILYTSGTTGRSKGAMLTHANLVSNALTLVGAWGFTAADRLLHALPIFHTHGLFVATNTIVAAGASMLLLESFDAERVLAELPQATVMMGVPTFYTRLLANPSLDAAAVSSIRLFVSGSAPLSAETHHAFAARTGHAILERYGMTETNMNSSNPLVGTRLPGSVGRPLPGVALRIVDPEGGAPLATDEIGMIEVRGPNVFKGYWRNPEKTAAEFRADGFFITGDLGRIDADGYVWIMGRGKDLVISGGFNVYPAEVEGAVERLEGVAECAVIGVPHPDFGEGVVAVVTAAPGASLAEAEMRGALRDELAAYKLPKRILIEPELPRNAMGKVQKAELRRRFASLFTD